MIKFCTQVDSMGPYYAPVDLNDKEISKDSVDALAKIISEADGSIACEIKEDGFRFQPHVNKQEMRFFSRGRDATKSTRFEAKCLPEIVDALARQRLKQTILDCELKGVKSGFEGYKAMQARARYEGRISDAGIQKYLRKDKLPEQHPLELVVFDALMRNGKDCTSLPYLERRKIVEDIASEEWLIRPSKQKLVLTPEEIIALYKDKVQKQKMEGLVLKQPNLEYLPGDKTHWVKLKKFETLDLVVIGVAGDFGQALVASYNPDNKQYQAVGVINLVRDNPATGNVFSEDIYEQIADKLQKSPATNVVMGSRTAFEHVRPENSVVLEVRAMNIERTTRKDFACSNDGKTFYSLRTAYIKNIREDKTSSQATTSQQIAGLQAMQR